MKATTKNTTVLILTPVIVLLLMAQAPSFGAERARDINFQSLKAVVLDLARTFPDQYTQSETYLREIETYERVYPDILAGVQQGQPPAIQQFHKMVAWKRRLLLDNPLLDFDKLLVIRRKPLGE